MSEAAGGPLAADELLGLDGYDGVLERRVVQLHHVRALDARSLEAARQVHVDDVEAAAEGDAEAVERFERAIRDLTGLGLLHCPGGVVVPSHAAIRCKLILGA